MDNEKLNPYFKKPKKKLTIVFDARFLAVILLLVIAGMLWVWKPWNQTKSDRTVSITGEATVKAVPDEFVFNPSYQFKGQDSQTALSQMNKKSSEITAKLKEIGVSDSDIKSNSSGYNGSQYYAQSSANTNQYTYTLRLTITAHDQTSAQKVEDYLTSTGASGTISPTAQFSENKRKQLENQARNLAGKDARSQADQEAKNLGFKIISVKSVQDGNQFKNVYPLFNSTQELGDTNSANTSLKVQPGENDLDYSVTVVYFIR